MGANKFVMKSKPKTREERDERRLVRKCQDARAWVSRARSWAQQGKPLSPRALVELERMLLDVMTEASAARGALSLRKGAVASPQKRERAEKLTTEARRANAAEYGHQPEDFLNRK